MAVEAPEVSKEASTTKEESNDAPKSTSKPTKGSKNKRKKKKKKPNRSTAKDKAKTSAPGDDTQLAEDAERHALGHADTVVDPNRLRVNAADASGGSMTPQHEIVEIAEDEDAEEIR